VSKLLQVVAAAVVFAAGSSLTLAADQGAGKGGALVLSESVTATATVAKIKSKQREITLRNSAGAEMTVIAGDEVRNFAQIKKGDVVEIEYHVAVASKLEKVTELKAAGQATEVARAAAGGKPGMAAAHVRTIVAKVLEVDTKNRMLTAQGPRGNVVTVKVPAEMKAFDGLKKGDRISAIYSEAVAVSVKTPEKKK